MQTVSADQMATAQNMDFFDPIMSESQPEGIMKSCWVGAGYTNGLLAVWGGMNVRNPNVSFFGNATMGTPSASIANSTYPIYSGFLSAHSYQVVGAGGSYTLGRFCQLVVCLTWTI